MVRRTTNAVPVQPRDGRAVVVGGSIAGLFAAAFLRRSGWQVDIYERSSVELVGRGAGIFATHLELLEALDKCGAGTVDLGVIADGRIALDREGNVIAREQARSLRWGKRRVTDMLLSAADTSAVAVSSVEPARGRADKGCRTGDPTLGPTGWHPGGRWRAARLV